MSTIVRLMLILVLIFIAAPAYAGEASHTWKCEMNGDTTEEEVIAMAQEWLKVAKAIKGGERLKASVHFPVAVNAIGEIDFFFVVVAPSFEEWGRFWDNYAVSPAVAELEKQHNEKIACPDSALWESVKIK